MAGSCVNSNTAARRMNAYKNARPRLVEVVLFTIVLLIHVGIASIVHYEGVDVLLLLLLVGSPFLLFVCFFAITFLCFSPFWNNIFPFGWFEKLCEESGSVG
jgi:uncharacterized membrane protein